MPIQKTYIAKDNAEVSLIVDDEALATFGVKAGMRVSTSLGLATIIGVMARGGAYSLWFGLDRNSVSTPTGKQVRVSYWDTIYNTDDLAKINFKIVRQALNSSTCKSQTALNHARYIIESGVSAATKKAHLIRLKEFANRTDLNIATKCDYQFAYAETLYHLWKNSDWKDQIDINEILTQYDNVESNGSENQKKSAKQGKSDLLILKKKLLLEAIDTNNAGLITALLKDHKNIESKVIDDEGNTLLHKMSKSKEIEQAVFNVRGLEITKKMQVCVNAKKISAFTTHLLTNQVAARAYATHQFEVLKDLSIEFCWEIADQFGKGKDLAAKNLRAFYLDVVFRKLEDEYYFLHKKSTESILELSLKLAKQYPRAYRLVGDIFYNLSAIYTKEVASDYFKMVVAYYPDDIYANWMCKMAALQERKTSSWHHDFEESLQLALMTCLQVKKKHKNQIVAWSHLYSDKLFTQISDCDPAYQATALAIGQTYRAIMKNNIRDLRALLEGEQGSVVKKVLDDINKILSQYTQKFVYEQIYINVEMQDFILKTVTPCPSYAESVKQNVVMIPCLPIPSAPSTELAPDELKIPKLAELSIFVQKYCGQKTENAEVKAEAVKPPASPVMKSLIDDSVLPGVSKLGHFGMSNANLIELDKGKQLNTLASLKVCTDEPVAKVERTRIKAPG